MIELPIEKKWTGDGFAANPITLKQVKRNDKVAIYSRASFNGRDDGFEVFIIKMRHKGDKLPGGMVEEEDREVYPSANSFGRSAWHIRALKLAMNKFDELTIKANEIVDEDEEESSPKSLLINLQEFSVNDIAESNSTNYITASNFIKEGIANGTIIFLREERRNARGKLTKVYSKKTS